VGKLRCPYKGCEKPFVKPSVLTEGSGFGRRSFYACPFCSSRIEVVADGLKVVDVRAVDFPSKVFESPAKCAHYSGAFRGRSGEGGLPDECLVCPKVLQCDARRK
jgi:hypothetical protein